MKRFLILIIFIASNSYAAGIQKWVDESGNVHYGDTPPVKVQTQSISVTRPPSDPGKPLPRFTGSKDEKETTTESADQKTQQNKNSQDVNKKFCESTRKNLDVISNNNIIRLKQADGSERFLSDEEVDERRKKLQKDIKKYCN